MTDNALPILRGRIARPQRGVIYGPEGVGKSTLASQFPAPVFIDAEGGTAQLDVDRFPQPREWRDITSAVDRLSTSEHPFRTLVIDTADWAEKLLSEHICRKTEKDSLEDFGYGKGWTYLGEEWGRFLASLEPLRERGMHILFLAHATIRKFEQPDAAGAYDRFELKLSKGCAAQLKEWCDIQLFANYYTKVTETDGKRRAVGGRERQLHTTHSAAYDAKNRHGLPETIPMSFAGLASVFPSNCKVTQPAPPPPPVPTGPASAEQVAKIELYWATLKKSPEDKTKAFAWLGADVVPGVENWSDLTDVQAARLIALLQKKMNELGSATGEAIAAAGREVLS